MGTHASGVRHSPRRHPVGGRVPDEPDKRGWLRGRRAWVGLLLVLGVIFLGLRAKTPNVGRGMAAKKDRQGISVPRWRSAAIHRAPSGQSAVRRRRRGGRRVRRARTGQAAAGHRGGRRGIAARVLPAADAVRAAFASRLVEDAQALDLRHGRTIPAAGIAGTYGAFDSAGALIALVVETNGVARSVLGWHTAG